MSLLQPATQSQVALKLAAQGEQGSGKSLTLTMLAIGLSRTYHNQAPIAFFDTEKQSDFVKAACDVEGVPLMVMKSKSFIDMRDAFLEAESSGCCAFIVDSYMHPYVELQESFKKSADLIGRRTQFHHRDQPQLLWEHWTDTWKASKLHCLFASRLGFKWGDSIDEQGDVQKVKLGTRMRGDNDSGYEPNIVIEIESIEDMELRHRKTKGKQGTNTHWLRVVKDRCMVLNGRNFGFKELNGYKYGDFQKVFDAIKPHLDCLAINRSIESESPVRSSVGLFSTPRGESAFAERERRVEIAIGEIDEALAFFWPSSNGTEDKRLRAIVKQMLFGVRSDAAIKTLLPERLEAARAVIGLFETAVNDPEQKINVKSEAEVIDLMTSCLQLGKEMVF